MTVEMLSYLATATWFIPVVLVAEIAALKGAFLVAQICLPPRLHVPVLLTDPGSSGPLFTSPRPTAGKPLERGLLPSFKFL